MSVPRPWLPVLCLLALLCAPVLGDGAPSSLSEKEQKVRLDRLKTRATDWWSARKGLVHACRHCRGYGNIRIGRRIIECPTCHRRKWVVDDDRYRKLFYEMKTPAFRLLPESRERVTEDYKAALAKRPIDIDKYKFSLETVDDVHAVAQVLENDDTVARPQRWIWVEEAGKKGEWFLWDERSDGPWPGASAPEQVQPAVSGIPPLSDPKPAALEESAPVAEAVSGITTMSFSLSDVSVCGETLVLTFSPKSGLAHKVARENVSLDAVASTRALFRGTSWKAIHATWRSRYRDKLGQVEERTYAISYMDRATFDKVVWSNLSDQEQTDVLTWSMPRHDGWVEWD